MRLRKYVHNALELSERGDAVGRFVDIALIVLIAINIVSVILETIDWIYVAYEPVFLLIEGVSVGVFSIEYALRLWSCVEADEHQNHTLARLKYMVTPMAIIDLIAILPFYLAFILTIDLRFLRVLRLLRIFKLTRYSSAMTMLFDVFREEANSFFAGFFILIVLLILAASGAFLVEHDSQPDKFGSIPDAMWWAMATLTTVGYGDVTPITAMGKLFGAVVTVVGVGMAALPAGILASGLADQLRRKRETLTALYREALEDGTIDAQEEIALEELRKNLGLSRRLADEIRQTMDIERTAAQKLRCPHCGKELPSRYFRAREPQPPSPS